MVAMKMQADNRRHTKRSHQTAMSRLLIREGSKHSVRTFGIRPAHVQTLGGRRGA